MALRNGQGRRKKYLTLELSSVSDLVENVCAIVSEFQSAKIGDEDRCRIRKDHAPENMVAMRHITLNLLRQEHTRQMSLRQKKLPCSLDEHYLLTMLSRAT
jgi:predicted transposase YbfD/YdcC